VENGFKYISNFLDSKKIEVLEDIINRFHSKWIQENQEHYNTRAVNSAYLTDPSLVSQEDRKELFQLITDNQILCELKQIFSNKKPAFLNTQLFFDPVNKNQKNYWHRDVQYTGMSVNEQRRAIEENPNNVVHFRIALKDENGVELIPTSHNRWDTDEEYKVRLELDGRKSSDDLLEGKRISLKKGDLLIFSANMIHRGLYGNDRMSLDILFCETDPEILKYRKSDCMPTQEELVNINGKELFYLG